jgi:hypothetical protein
MANGSNTTINLKITGDGKAGVAAINQVVAGLKDLGIQTDKTSKQVQATAGKGFDEFGKSVKATLKDLGGLVIAAVGAKEFISLGLASLENAKALNEMSQEVGISIETLSVLQLEARKMNLDTQALSVGLRGLSASLKQVQQGNVQTIQAFASLNLNAEELVKISSGPNGMEGVFFRVAEALTQFQDGANKSAVVQDLLGGRATKLIPLMQSLAGDGFDKATASAEKLGAVLRESDVRIAEEFEASMVSLKQQTTALSRSFLEGLIPGVVGAVDGMDALTGSTEGAREVFRTFGEGAGAALKIILGGLNEVLGTVNTLIFALAKDPGSTFKLFFSQLIGNQVGVANALASMSSDVKNFAEESENQSRAFWEKLLAPPEGVGEKAQAARDKAIADLNTSVTKLRNKGKEVEGIDISTLSTGQIVAKTKELNNQLKQVIKIAAADQQQVSKALSDARLAALDRELAVTKEKTDQFVSAATATFDQGRGSLEAFFAARRAAIETQGAAELSAAKGRVDALQKQLNGFVGPRADKITLETELLNAQNAVALTGLQIEGRRLGIITEETGKRKELSNTYIEFQKALAEVQGKNLEAALLGIDQQVEAFRIQLEQIGIAGEAAANQLKAFRDAAASKAQLDNLVQQAGFVSSAIQNNEAKLKALVDQGIISQAAATVQQTQFVAAQGSAVSSLLSSFEALKATATDPTVIQAIDAQIVQLENLQVAALAAQSQIALFGQQSLVAGGRALLGFLNDLSDGAGTVSEAFADMVRSFISSIIQMINQILVLEAITLTAKALGVPVPSGGFGFAQGGAVPGSGNGDSVRAMLTPGEFVLNKKMVSAMGGLVALERMRLALRGGGNVVRGGVSHFAEGGIVAGSPTLAAVGAGGDVTRVIVELEDGLIARQIENGPAGRAVIRSIGKQRNAANDALGNRGGRL